jgi:hypothetical protein
MADPETTITEEGEVAMGGGLISGIARAVRDAVSEADPAIGAETGREIGTAIEASAVLEAQADPAAEPAAEVPPDPDPVDSDAGGFGGAVRAAAEAANRVLPELEAHGRYIAEGASVIVAEREGEAASPGPGSGIMSRLQELAQDMKERLEAVVESPPADQEVIEAGAAPVMEAAPAEAAEPTPADADGVQDDPAYDATDV